MESIISEIKEVLLDIHKLLVRLDPGCQVILGGSATTGRLTLMYHKPMILLSDLDLYVRSKQCLSVHRKEIKGAGYTVSNFVVSPSSKISIRCCCDSCVISGVESSKLYQHCLKYGENLIDWVQSDDVFEKIPKAYLPERLGGAYCLMKTVLYSLSKSDYSLYSSFYQIYKFSELYGGIRIKFVKDHRYRGLESSSFMMMIEGAVEYFKSVLNRHLSTDNYEYICTILDSISSRKISLNSTDARRIEGVIYELCGSSTSFELKNWDISSLFDSNKSKDSNVLRVSYS